MRLNAYTAPQKTSYLKKLDPPTIPVVDYDGLKVTGNLSAKRSEVLAFTKLLNAVGATGWDGKGSTLPSDIGALSPDKYSAFLDKSCQQAWKFIQGMGLAELGTTGKVTDPENENKKIEGRIFSVPPSRDSKLWKALEALAAKVETVKVPTGHQKSTGMYTVDMGKDAKQGQLWVYASNRNADRYQEPFSIVAAFALDVSGKEPKVVTATPPR